MDWTLDNLMWLRGKYHFPESQSFLWLINLKNSFWKWRMLLVTFLCWKHVVLKRQGYVLSWRDRHTSACPLDTRKGTACCSCPGIRGSEWRLGQRKGMFGRKQEIVKSGWGRPVGETQAGWERGNRPGLQEWGERTQPYKDSEARWGGEASGSVWGGSGSLQANQRDFRCQVHWGQGALELGRTRAEETSWVILCDGRTVENDWVPTSLKGSLGRERARGARSLWKMWGAVHWVEIYKVWI